jgi:hypothetical protein
MMMRALFDEAGTADEVAQSRPHGIGPCLRTNISVFSVAGSFLGLVDEIRNRGRARIKGPSWSPSSRNRVVRRTTRDSPTS